MTTKTVDARGRLTLGPEFANTLVIFDKRPDGVVEITPAEAVPVSEPWLLRNPKALAAVQAGIEAAKAGRFAAPPEIPAEADEEEA